MSPKRKIQRKFWRELCERREKVQTLWDKWNQFMVAETAAIHFESLFSNVPMSLVASTVLVSSLNVTGTGLTYHLGLDRQHPLCRLHFSMNELVHDVPGLMVRQT